MSEQENSKINYLIQKFEEHSEYVKVELSTIKRGVYGDPYNKVLGLMDRQLEDERRIKAIEDDRKSEQIKKKTVLWIGGIIWAALQVIFIIIYEFFLGKH